MKSLILKHTRIQSPSSCPEISLYLADSLVPLWEATSILYDPVEDTPPPYWGFCWAGGHALSRYLLDNAGLVRNKRLLDFASGSGVVGIAAALSGAKVETCDIDPLSRMVTLLNAELNNVEIDCIDVDVLQIEGQIEVRWDVVVAGDVCYEGDMSRIIWSWLLGLARSGVEVLLADPGRKYLPQVGLVPVFELQVETSREIENTKTKWVTVHRVDISKFSD